MDRDVLLEKLTALDFMAVDFGLFLDTHPDDKEAISVYNDIVKEASKVRCVYEKTYGPLCSYRSSSNDKMYTWIDDPWPWCKNFNFKPLMCREEK